MDTTRLQNAYARFLDAAATPDLGPAQGGEWDADQVLAHVLSVDASVTAVALGVIAGARPGFDNRVSLDTWNLGRIIAEHGGRLGLVEQVRRQATVLCQVASHLASPVEKVMVSTLLVSHDAVVVDQPLTLRALISGLADDHLPVHTQQLLGLRGTGAARGARRP